MLNKISPLFVFQINWTKTTPFTSSNESIYCISASPSGKQLSDILNVMFVEKPKLASTEMNSPLERSRSQSGPCICSWRLCRSKRLRCRTGRSRSDRGTTGNKINIFTEPKINSLLPRDATLSGVHPTHFLSTLTMGFD